MTEIEKIKVLQGVLRTITESEKEIFKLQHLLRIERWQSTHNGAKVKVLEKKVAELEIRIERLTRK